jgi:hypothetical protein
MYKIGDIPGGAWAAMPLEERFWRRVQKTRSCWKWLGTFIRPMGYGTIYVNGRNILTHRFSWELANGPVPEGLYVLHKCDNPPCVRPDHLFLGTYKDNFEDMRRKGRWYNHFAHVTYIHRGEEAGTAKLTEREVKKIRTLRATGEWTLQALADKFKVSKSNVLFIVQRKSWTHVP